LVILGCPLIRYLFGGGGAGFIVIFVFLIRGMKRQILPAFSLGSD
jgi:hypothetical protein